MCCVDLCVIKIFFFTFCKQLSVLYTNKIVISINILFIILKINANYVYNKNNGRLIRSHPPKIRSQRQLSNCVQYKLTKCALFILFFHRYKIKLLLKSLFIFCTPYPIPLLTSALMYLYLLLYMAHIYHDNSRRSDRYFVISTPNNIIIYIILQNI